MGSTGGKGCLVDWEILQEDTLYLGIAHPIHLQHPCHQAVIDML